MTKANSEKKSTSKKQAPLFAVLLVRAGHAMTVSAKTAQTVDTRQGRATK